METIKFREAKGRSKLPKKLSGLKIVGSYNGKLFLASEIEHNESTIIFSYSLEKKKILNVMKSEKGAYAVSWAQNDNRLYVGTRWGNMILVDMEKSKIIEEKQFENSIDCIAVSFYGEIVCFGVNGVGIYKSNSNLSSIVEDSRNVHHKSKSVTIKSSDLEKIAEDKKHKPIPLVVPRPVASAMTFDFDDDKLYVFYFSNGNDPMLDGKPAGGMVEVMDRDFKVLNKRDTMPYAISLAKRTKDKILFSTRAVNDGWKPEGSGALYDLKPCLSFKKLLSGSAINIFQPYVKYIYVGYKSGNLIRAEKGDDGEFSTNSIVCGSAPVTGLNFEANTMYVSWGDGVINAISLK